MSFTATPLSSTGDPVIPPAPPPIVPPPPPAADRSEPIVLPQIPEGWALTQHGWEKLADLAPKTVVQDPVKITPLTDSGATNHDKLTAAVFRFTFALLALAAGALIFYFVQDPTIKILGGGLITAAVLSVEEYLKTGSVANL